MRGIFTYIYPIIQPNVGKYTRSHIYLWEGRKKNTPVTLRKKKNICLQRSIQEIQGTLHSGQLHLRS